MSEHPPTPPGSQDVLLEMRDIVKVFPGVVALDHARLTVMKGEVHAIVGQNGAGKSTLMKVLNGAYRKDGGTIVLDGREVDFITPHQAQVGGISTIYQEINLVPFRSVAENIFMGREPRRFGLIDWPRMNREAREILAHFGIQLDVKQPLLNLNVALQQMVAIARAVSFGSKLVIMDEPTSSLDEREVATLFDAIHRLKASGVSVIYISHRLDELHEVGDNITIMRDGQTIEETSLASVSKLEIVARMLGKNIGELRREGTTGFAERKVDIESAPFYRAAHIEAEPVLRDASVELRKGEILGLSGLLGSGRTELARILFGADKPDQGSLTLDGKPSPIASPRDAIREGIGYCSEDRKAEGIIPEMSVRENLTLAALPTLTKNGIIDPNEQQAIVDRFVALLSIKTSDVEQPISQLSGGNQQKVLLARWLCLNPRLLLLDEPTRGIDVGAKAEIHHLIETLADEGMSVLMITSEIEEIVEGSNRVTVLRDGQTVAEFDRAQIGQDAIIAAMAEGSDPMPDTVEV
ncbi:MAG: sugar ABC transporter ATP-binding protein [Thermomicrobiales bacterium]|nr:sugar ABC transporter ATP-binding protein [Thermomicrobiales bacterium]